MKWYEFSDDLGDGTVAFRRFKTREEAEQARQLCEENDWWVCDGDGSPVQEVDTDSPGFFDSVEDFKDM